MLDTEERYGVDRHTKSYQKRKLLPEFDDAAVPPKENSTKKPDVPLHNHNRAAGDTAHDLREHLDKKAGAARSIYGPREDLPAYREGHNDRLNRNDRVREQQQIRRAEDL